MKHARKAASHRDCHYISLAEWQPIHTEFFHIEWFQKELTHKESLQIEIFHTEDSQIQMAYEGPPVQTELVQIQYVYMERKIHVRFFHAMVAVFLFLY